MATDSLIRLIDNGGMGNMALYKDTTLFSASSGNILTEELGLLLEGQKYNGNCNIKGPSRSGSAPPSMEASRAAFDFPKTHPSFNNGNNIENLTNAVQACKSEEQIRAHPAYFAYYCANVNLNPRLPPPLVSRENRHLVHQVGSLGDYLKLHSSDDSNKVTFFHSRPSLSTHKEEPEDDKPPGMISSNWIDQSNAYSGHLAPPQGMHTTLADSVQEEFPRTLSTVHIDHHPPRHISANKSTNQDNWRHSSDYSKQELAPPTYELHFQHSDPSVHAARSKVDASNATEPVQCSKSSGGGPKIDSRNEYTGSRISSIGGACTSLSAVETVETVETEMKSLRIFSDDHKSQRSGQHLHQVGLSAWESSSQPQLGQTQLLPQGIHYPQNISGLFSRGQSKPEVQQVLQSASITQPFYATTNAYGGTLYYPNLQPHSYFFSPFGMGGYAIGASMLSSYTTNYPPNYTYSVPIENPRNPQLSAGYSGISSGGLTPDMQQVNKVYGQLGFPIQPSFPEQFYVPYFQHPSADAYVPLGPYSSMNARENATGSQLGTYDLQKVPAPSTYLTDQKTQVARISSSNIFDAKKGSIMTPSYYGSLPNLGFVQYNSSTVASSAFQGSETAGASFSGRRNDNFRNPFAPGRSAGSGWQGQRGREMVEDLKSMSLLEELKSNKTHRYKLSDIAGNIVEFSVDQYGSRFIQNQLEVCDAEEKELVFKEVLPHCSMLIVDVFGNYVIQKFFDYGTPEQRNKLANKLVGNVLSLSLQMYGCRVIQKALEVIELDQKTQLVQELDGNVMRCVRDQNGNHVIQKCIECVPTVKIGFIIYVFHSQVAVLSMHPYGCRVIQRVLEHCTDKSQTQFIVDEILQSACHLAQDQYGNYVIQHILEKGKPNERGQIISILAGQIVHMSQHKFASNVIEKCLVYGSSSERDQLIEEIVGQTEGNDNLLVMMKDQFANYVVQKIFENCTDKQREILLDRIKVHLPALKKYTYGKHIVARIEQLCVEDIDCSES